MIRRPRAQTLFHFTKDCKTLKNILSNGFWPRYSLEDLSWCNNQKLAFPMVCFCDIPLSRIGEHVSFYGNYGLGLSLEWGHLNKLNPVWYLSNTTQLSKSLFNALSTLNVSGFDVNRIGSYIKPVSGEIKKRDIKLKEFYQESEWRYVPDSVCVPWIDKKTYEDKEEISKLNKSTWDNAMLRFEADDVKYVFVKCNKDIPKIIDIIQKIKSDRFSDEQKKLLFSRVISLENLREDM